MLLARTSPCVHAKPPMTTIQEKDMPQGNRKTGHVQRTSGWAENGSFSIRSGSDLLSGNFIPEEEIKNKFTKPYFTAISGSCEENHPAQSCTFVTRPGSIRFADSDRALASPNTQPGKAARIQPEIRNPISKQIEL